MDTYKVKGASSDGATFYVDGSASGRIFDSLDEAIAYAEDYARTVAGRKGLVTVPGESEALLRSTKEDGYWELIYVLRGENQ